VHSKKIIRNGWQERGCDRRGSAYGT
jgi:hypothetical protein